MGAGAGALGCWSGGVWELSVLFGLGAGEFELCGSEIEDGAAGRAGAASELGDGIPSPSNALKLCAFPDESHTVDEAPSVFRIEPFGSKEVVVPLSSLYAIVAGLKPGTRHVGDCT